MKRILCSALALVLTLSLFGCSNKYKPVDSTAEESRVMLTLTADGKKYEVKYELYRALFLANRDTVDGGDATVWSSDNKAEYIEKINAIIISHAAKIYGTLHVASALGFEPYSKTVDDAITENVKGAVEGDGTQDGLGSYEAYLAALKASYLNYSVAALLVRYSLAVEDINDYYLSEPDGLGAPTAEYEYTEEDVRTFYNGGDCARVLVAYFPTGIRTLDDVEGFREALEDLDDYGRAAYILGNTSANAYDLIVIDENGNDRVSGTVLGRDALGKEYAAYVDAVFATEAGAVSEIVELQGTDADGYYLICGLEKSAEHLALCYDSIAYTYLEQVIGASLSSAIDAMTSSVKYSSAYEGIAHAGISMD